MRVIPIGNNVVVKRQDAEATTAGGIVLPDAAQERPARGKILSVGDGKLLDSGERAPHQVREGDRVLFSRWAGTEVSIDGHELLIMNEDEILAIVD